ncbi:hypothetical protein LWI28_014834 [Acer negundo]|uniref:Uncharacterized protein n=1 Tax=Acer negundo TaxID=4023 RepID=A0AAD5P252_ACENE|nr:hypothetical protein LWI28_014834 [Acer negundo]
MEVDPLEHELEDFEEDEDENEETIETIDSSNEWTAHKEAEGWRDKSFPLYERLVNIFGKDGATGQVAGTPQQILDEVNSEGTNMYGTGNMEGVGSQMLVPNKFIIPLIWLMVNYLDPEKEHE